MKEIMAIVRMNMMNKTKRALADAGFGPSPPGMPWGAAKASWTCNCSRAPKKAMKKPSPNWVRASGLFPSAPCCMVVNDKLVEKTVKTIIKTNRTGKSGDGMIFVLPCQEAVRVRTGERGDDTLDDG